MDVDTPELPVSHEAVLQAHEKAVTALSLDPKGSRMVTGSMDGSIKYYDFNGMAEDKNAFRSLDPVEGHMVQALSFSTTGGILLAVCSDAHARIYDRDGSAKPIQSTVKGDMYVRDMTHTKGHTQMLTGGMWHPFHQDQWMTCSLDGTLRLWDLNASPVGMDQVLPSVHVLKTLDKRNVCVGGASGKGGGLYPTCCAYSPSDAKKMVGGCSDGSVQLFFEKARYQKPDRILRTAHTAALTDVTFVQEGTQSNLMVTRSLDDTVKVWDCRALSDAKGPVKAFYDIKADNEKAGVCASPDGRFIAAGTPYQKNTPMGEATIQVYDVKTLQHVKRVSFEQRSPIVFKWPAELNQLIVGCRNGDVAMLYNPQLSKKGALHFVGKAPKARAKAQDVEGAPVFNMTDRDDIKKFYATGHGNMFKIRRHEARQAQKTITPARPPPGGEGTAGAQGDGAAFAAAVLKAGAKQLNLNNTRTNLEDSQKALLKYQDKASKDPILVGRAYKNSGEQVLDWSADVSEGDKRMNQANSGDFCRKCGQKVCRCVDYSIIYGPGANKKQKTG